MRHHFLLLLKSIAYGVLTLAELGNTHCSGHHGHRQCRPDHDATMKLREFVVLAATVQARHFRILPNEVNMENALII